MAIRQTTETGRSVNMAYRLILILAFCVAVAGAGPVLAQPASEQLKAFQERIDEVGRSFENNPRFKGLNQQQRIDRVEFVFGNTLFILLHEMGHVHVHEHRLPILGREEDAADTFAALRLIRSTSAFSQRVLTDAAKGWFFSDRRARQTGDPMLYYDEHNLSRQRAYEIVCLMVGADPVKFKELADQTGLPAKRRESCKKEYDYASWSWETVLAPHRRAPDEPKTKIDVVYGEGKDQFAGLANAFRTIKLLETVAAVAADAYAWRAPFTLEMQTCDGPNAGWDDERRTLKICYNLAFDFSELYRAYASAPLVDTPPARAALPTNAQPGSAKPVRGQRRKAG